MSTSRRRGLSTMSFVGTIDSGTLANRPAAGVANRYYWATDVEILYRDTGAAWETVGYGGFEHNRYLTDVFTGMGYAGFPYGIGINRIDATPIIIPYTVTVDRIIIIPTTANGNTLLAIYNDNGDTPNGGSQIVISASTPVVANQRFEVPITDTRLTPNLYWILVAFDTGENVQGPDFRPTIPNPLSSWDLATLAYDLPDPCPALNSGNVSRLFSAYLRIKSVP